MCILVTGQLQDGFSWSLWDFLLMLWLKVVMIQQPLRLAAVAAHLLEDTVHRLEGAHRLINLSSKSILCCSSCA